MKDILYNSQIALRRWPVILALLIIAAAALVKWQSSLMPEDTYILANPSPAVNAKTYFEKATTLLTPEIGKIAPNGTDMKNDAGTSYNDYTQSQKDEIILKNRPAFAELEQGFSYPYEDMSKRSFFTLFPMYAKERAVARALNSAGDDSVAHGDWDGAMNDSLDSVQMGAMLPHGSSLIGMLVGEACEAIGRHNAYGLIAHLTYDQSVSAVRRLETINSLEQQPYECLADEEHFTQGSLLDLFRTTNWRKELTGDSSDSNDSSSGNHTDLITEIRWHTESPRTAFDNYTKAMNAEIAISQLAWPQQIHHPAPQVPSDPINQMLFPIFTQATFREYGTLTGDRLIEIEIALHAYKLAHGNYPAKLDELTPSLLTAIPDDPFSNNQPFKYRLTGSKYLLYSIGPDAVDDGGKPIFDNSPSRKLIPYQLYQSDQKGDVVAGFNNI